MHRLLRARTASLLVGLVAVLALAACGSSSSGGGSGGGGVGGGIKQADASGSGSGKNAKKLLWVQPLRDHPVHKIMQAGFLSECKKLGYSCEIVGNHGATFDVPASISLAKAALASGTYKAVGVYAADPGLYPFIKELGQQGRKVVSWHFPFKQGTVPGLSAITGCKPDQYARLVADAMGKQMGGKGSVAVTQGSYNETENLVTKTFAKTITAKYPGIKVLKPQLEGFEPSAAVSKAVGILQGHPDVAGAFSTTGSGPETWSGAARQTGKKLTIISMDYVRQNLDIVKKGEVYAIVAQPLFQEGAKTADLLAQLAEGKQVPYYNWLPAPIVTKADIGSYYTLLDQSGQ